MTEPQEPLDLGSEEPPAHVRWRAGKLLRRWIEVWRKHRGTDYKEAIGLLERIGKWLDESTRKPPPGDDSGH